MRVCTAILLGLAAGALYSSAANCFAQDSGQRFAARTPGANSASAQKFTLILFWKEDNAATQEMAAALAQGVAQRADVATSTKINIRDAANQAIVERYKVSRAPMPMVLCIAPNGAITGGIPDRVTDQSLDRVLVTPTMTLCMKALQEDKLVLVHVRANDDAGLPKGASDFAADPEFQARTVAVTFRRDDPRESRFLSDMDIHPNAVNGSIVSLLAPPGVLVGKFPDHATKEQFAEGLHAAGKCCNDPNCKHNKKGK